jgi:heptosyltransferase-2
LKQIRAQKFVAALSVRKDPREHFLIWLARVPRRIGFLGPGSGLFLNEPIKVHDENAHRVEDWWKVQQAFDAKATSVIPPRLVADTALAQKFQLRFSRDSRPVLALHCGARIAVRRWPEAYLRELLANLRREFDFQLVLFPDLDGYGAGLQDLAEHTLERLNLEELVAALSCAKHLICNDSGPSHIADALNVPAITLFGPGSPEKLGPFRKHNHVVIRDTCPYHPCSDYCRYAEPYCLTKLTPLIIWPEVRNYLREQGRLPVLASQPEVGGGKAKL